MSNWHATLAVDAREGGRLLVPRVRINGRDGFARGTLRVELRDEHDVVRRVARRPLTAESLGRELRMPSFTVPEDAGAGELARWPWGIAVEGCGAEVVRWRRYLAAGSLNPEGEIELSESRDPRRAKEEAEGKGPEAPWNERDSERLLAVLVGDGELSERDRDVVLAMRASTGKTVERVLIELSWVDERELFAVYAELTGTELVELSECSIDPAAASLIPEEIARGYGLVGIGFRDDELLTVAMSDPQAPRAALDVEAATWRRAYIVVATRGDVLSALEAALGLSPTSPELSA